MVTGLKSKFEFCIICELTEDGVNKLNVNLFINVRLISLDFIVNVDVMDLIEELFLDNYPAMGN